MVVLRVVTEQEALKALNIEKFDSDSCCECNLGTACFKSALLSEAVQNNLSGTTQVTQIIPFMALHGGIKPKQLFFYPRTFGFTCHR
jgi:hypothetical protein